MRRRTRTMTAVAAGLGLAVTSLLWNAPPASAEPECLTGSSDFDRDGTPDVAVGVPGGSGRAGAVQVRLSNEGEPFTTTVTGAPGFGTAVTSLSSYAGEGDDELCSQLVVGSPDESTRPDLKRSGVVYVYSWSSSAKRFTLRSTFEPQSQGVEGEAQSGARFGAALAAEQRPADQSDPRPERLYVGAPGFDAWDPDTNTGRVTSFWIDADEDPSAHDTETVQLGEPVTDEPTPGAALGSSLSAANGLIAMGMPGFPTIGRAGSGAVLVDSNSGDPDRPGPLLLSQATAGVPGTAERGDRFGAAVHLVPDPAGRAPTLLVGAPGEDVGRAVDAGAVTVARISLSTLEPTGSVRTLDQNSAGMGGTAEAGDQLGAAVSSMRYGSSVAYLVGAPGEDVGRTRDAGMVQTIGNGKNWTQSTSGVPGTAEAGDRMGASLAGSPATGATKPLIGLPGEDSSTGAVLVGLPIGGGSVSYLKGTTIGDRYGFTVAP